MSAVACPKCGVTGPAVSCRQDAEALALVHDGFHHAGRPTATVERLVAA